MIRALGQVVVPAPGTPVALNAVLPNQPDPKPLSFHGILVQALAGNTGLVYVGASNMVVATGVGVYAQIGIPTDNFIPTFSAALTIAPNGLSSNEFYIDADVADEGVLVTILVT